ncbi:unnamed protein product, partial [Closterium sp. NIES-53]
NVPIFDLDFDAILAAMYAVTDSAEGDCCLSVSPDPGIEAAALGASASAAPGTGESAAPGAGEFALSGTAPTEALHTFTLDSGALRSFFCDSTTLTPLSRPIAVSLADTSGGPVLAHSSTVLPCPAAPSGLLSGLHLPSFSTNLRVTHCTCSWTGRHLATFTRRSGSSLYTLIIASPPVAASGQVAASSQVFFAASRSSPVSAPCSCRPLSHETLLWHHCLGHPSLPRLRGMASRTLVSGLPRSLPPLPPGPAPTCVPCVEDRQRATPHSSEFPPTEAPLQTLHMDVWGPARVRGKGHKRYFLLVVDDYSRYTTVFPLRSKDRGSEFSSDLLRAFCRAEGIRQTFTPPASPQKKGIAERRIGMVMDVARTSMIHAAAPHFLWPFAVQYAAHQINLQPHVSLLETTPTLRWTRKVGDASMFRVWGSRAFVRDTSADKLSSRAVPCVFLGFPPDAPGWQFYHPTLRRVLSSQDVTFDESVSYYCLFPYRTASLPPSPLFLAPGTPSIDPLPPQGPAPSGVSQVDPVEPVEVTVDSGAARGAEPAGAETRGVRPGVSVSEGAEPGGAERERVEPGGAESGSAELGGAEPERAKSGGPPGVPSRREPLSPQQLREWYTLRCRRAAGAGAAGGASGATGGASGAGAAGGAAGDGAAGGTADAGATGAAGPVGTGAGGTGAVGVAGGAGTAGPGGARTGGTGAAGAGGVSGVGVTGVGGAAGVAAGDPGAEGIGAVSAVSGGAARPRPYYIPLLHYSQPGPSPYFGPTRGLLERREPESRPESHVRAVRTGHHVPRQRPPPVLHTHSMTLRPSTTPLRVHLPSPPTSSLPDGPDPESDSLRTASPTVTRFLASAVTDPSFESTAASALVAELVDLAAACRLDYATCLVAESESASVCPPSVGGECALGMDVLEDRQEDFECFGAAVPHLVSMLLALEGDPDAPDIPTPRSYAEAIEGPYSSQWQAAMDAEMASWNSTGTYVDKVPPPGANIVSGMWIFRLKRPPGSPPVFKVRYIARGFTQRQGVDFFQTFSPTPKMTTLRVLLHVAAHRDYELHSLDFSTAFLQGSLHKEIWLRRPPGFTGSFPAGTQWSLQRPVYGLHQAPREWHDTLRMTLAPLGFAPSTSDPSLFLRTDTILPPFYVLVYVDDLVFPTADTKALVHVLQRFGFTYSSPQSTPLPSGHSLSAQPSDESIYAGAMAAQELRWLTYLLTDLGEAPHSPPVLTKRISLRYFLAQEFQQRGQLRLAYVASQANTADGFTKALQPCDHQPCFAFLDWSCDLLFSPTLPMGKRHTCSYLGELRSYLQITRDREWRTITLTESHMVDQDLQRFGFQFSSPQPTPLSTGHSLSAPPSDESVEPSSPYLELVGCLMYMMTCTRPDPAYPLSLLARYVAPGRHRKVHWDAAKRVVRYLCSSSGMGLVLGGRGPVVLTGHADASWVDDSATQRSSQGYTFSLGFISVSRWSTRSSSVLISSCEAEIYAGAMAAQELRWLTYLLTDLGEQPRSPPVR